MGLEVFEKMRAIVIAAAMVIAAATDAAAQYSIDVVAADGRAVTVSLDGMERTTVITGDRGIKTTFEGVAMRDVLTKAGIKLGEALKGKALAQVLHRNREGRLPGRLRDRRTRCGVRRSDRARRRYARQSAADRRRRSMQIVVPLDKRAARWMRQVIKLELKQLQ